MHVRDINWFPVLQEFEDPGAGDAGGFDPGAEESTPPQEQPAAPPAGDYMRELFEQQQRVLQQTLEENSRMMQQMAGALQQRNTAVPAPEQKPWIPTESVRNYSPSQDLPEGEAGFDVLDRFGRDVHSRALNDAKSEAERIVEEKIRAIEQRQQQKEAERQMNEMFDKALGGAGFERGSRRFDVVRNNLAMEAQREAMQQRQYGRDKTPEQWQAWMNKQASELASMFAAPPAPKGSTPASRPPVSGDASGRATPSPSADAGEKQRKRLTPENIGQFTSELDAEFEKLKRSFRK